MSSVWMDAVCAGCGRPVADRAKAVAIVPCTTRATASWASGHSKGRGQLRVMPSKGRKDQQKPLLFHEECFTIVEGVD